MPVESFQEIIQSWDTASKLRQTNDPSCCQTFGVKKVEGGFKYYVLDVYKKRVPYPELKRMAVALYNKWKPSRVLIEDKSSGMPLVQDLKKSTALPIVSINPKGSKYQRLYVQTGKIEGGLLFLPSYAKWLDDYIAELTGFPRYGHDEIPDTLTQFLLWHSQKGTAKPRIRGF